MTKQSLGVQEIASVAGALTELIQEGGETDGYFCDQSAPGPRGGDLRDYYFMRGDTFMRIAFELFPTAIGLDGLNTILGNVTAGWH